MTVQTVGGVANPIPAATRPFSIPNVGRPNSGNAEKAESLAPSHSQLEQAVSVIQKTLTPLARDLLFSIDKVTGQTVVKLVDRATCEVIRQIPSQELLEIAHTLDKVKGLLINRQA